MKSIKRFIENLFVLLGNFNAIFILQGLKLKKQRSTGDINSKGVSNIRSTGSTTSWMSSESGYPSAAGSVVSQGSDQSFAAEVSKMFQRILEPTYMIISHFCYW